MKKFISGLSALITAAILIVPMSAYADDTTITPTGGTPFSVAPKPDTANTTVKFDVNPAYTVTIPATVTLEGKYGEIYKNSGEIKAEDVFLNEGKELVVTLASASKFNMAVDSETEYRLPYTVSTADFGKVDKEKGGTVAKFGTSKTAQTVTVAFETDETPQYAGVYTDTVVFTIGLQDIEKSQTSEETPNT